MVLVIRFVLHINFRMMARIFFFGKYKILFFYSFATHIMLCLSFPASWSMQPSYTHLLSSISLSRKREWQRSQRRTKAERWRQERPEANVRESWTTISNTVEVQKRTKQEVLRIKVPRRRKRDQEITACLALNWSMHIHLRQDPKLLSSLSRLKRLRVRRHWWRS